MQNTKDKQQQLMETDILMPKDSKNESIFAKLGRSFTLTSKSSKFSESPGKKRPKAEHKKFVAELD